ncbi:hypothetical protein [Maricaulis sp. CAU 1757]
MRLIGLVLAGALATGLAGAATADHHGDAPEVDPAIELAGAWNWGEGWTATFKPDGYLAAASDNVTMAILTWSLDGDRLTVRDLSPPVGAEDAACAVANDGVYAVALDGDGLLHFTHVEDPCPGRTQAFSNAVLERRAVPDVDITE